MIRLACLVRAHRRAASLDVVLSELKRYGTLPGLHVDTLVFLDRPTAGVEAVVEKHGIAPFYINQPVLSLHDGERFLEVQNDHLFFLDDCYPPPFEPDWVYVVDDDFALEPSAAARLPTELARTDVNAFYMPVLFIEDHPRTYNAARHHNSIRLYRHRPGARFTGRRMLSIPDELEEAAVISGRTAELGPLIEVGGYSAADRLACFEAYRLAGKNDAFTRALIEGRDLRPLPEHLTNPFESVLALPS